ncbi:MAG TPA: penicillin-binding transpeptidase domain-containing protein [Patescibacteria group bacterium]|nr:penicillin-binding transpeptidase domain-containing protein [Patescibacteria group bacterium]
MKSFPIFHKEKGQLAGFAKKKRSSEESRLYLLPLFFALVFLILTGRLLQLTIVKGNYFRHLAEDNRLKEIPIEAPRGKIIDRKGFTVAYSSASDTQGNRGLPRRYNDPYAFSHLLGYRQVASKEDMKNDSCAVRLKMNDMVGKDGLEKIYECMLRGKKGKKLVEIDAKGKPLKTISIVSPQEGKTVQLSIDLELQKYAYQALLDGQKAAYGKKAVIIASIPETGEILVLISMPSYSLEDFEINEEEKIRALFDNPDKPLFNRATHGIYPAGSIFKLFVATGGLEEKTIDEHFRVEDTGKITLGDKTFGNWYFLQYGKTEGMVDIITAIKRSNDIFFYTLGEKLGEKKIQKWAEHFGFGKKTGSILPDEEGLVPSVFWKQDVLKENWYTGDTYNLAIGQGYLLTTPLQVHTAAASFANGGFLCAPQFLKTTKEKPASCKKLELSQKTLDLVREGMREACSAGGTGWPFFDFPIPVGCKTGTAQSHAASGIPHAWFTVFAPFDKPEIAITVLVEETGEGSNVAAPIAKEILTSYFSRTQ